MGEFERPYWLLVAGRKLVGALGVIDVADSVAPSEHPDAGEHGV
jgi:hypothetical protein